MKPYFLIPILMLAACNSMNVKPNTMNKGELVYAQRGGYSMRKFVKEGLEKRGYSIVVGKAKSFGDGTSSDGGDFDIDSTIIPTNARYAINVKERRERFFPVWCFFNGYWLWNFNVSIADQKTGEELLAWSGRGCMNSTMRKLDDVLDKLEKK